MKNLLLIVSLFLSAATYASPDRIQALRFDRGQVMRVNLVPGLGSLVLFPCGLSEVFVGRSDDLLAQISPNDKRNLFLNLKLNSSLPTNIIAKCEDDKNIFVMDVIPSKSVHQDLIDIRSVFGQAKRLDVSGLTETSIRKNRKTIVKMNPVLVESGGGK